MLTRRRAAADQEEGFTLVELVLSVSLMGLVMLAVVGSVFFVLNARARTSGQLASSADRQIVASYFAEDVEGASGTAPFSTSALTLCDGTSVTPLVTVRGTDYGPGSITPVPVTVAYVYQPSTRELKRMSCRGTTGPVTTRSLARNVASAPSLSGSCTGAVAVSSTARALALTVPEAGNPAVVVCARRRAS